MRAAIAAAAGVATAALLFNAIVAKAGETMYVTGHSGLNVREEPSKDSRSYEVMRFGTAVDVIGENDGWCTIQYGGIRAYAASEWLSPTDPFLQMIPMGEWRVTAYAYTGSQCANGQYPTAGYTIAHNSLPFGTEVYIEGVGFRTVEDRGPEWLGEQWCDLYLGDEAECWQWGNQYRNVYIVNAEVYGDD